MGIQSELRSLSPSAKIELFELDTGVQGGPIYYFHGGLNGKMGPLTWRGREYVAIPIEATDFETKSNGALPSPHFKIANLQGAIAEAARVYSNFDGCKITRKRTYARYLDAVNFPDSLNPEADPNQALPDDIWYVDRKVHEDFDYLEFELVSAMELRGTKLPRRQIIANCCPSIYRSVECSYTGGPVADENNVPTSDPARDKCSNTRAGCKLRFPSGPLPYGGFLGAGSWR